MSPVEVESRVNPSTNASGSVVVIPMSALASPLGGVTTSKPAAQTIVFAGTSIT